MNETTQPISKKAAYTGDIPNTPVAFAWFTGRDNLFLCLLSGLGVIIAQTAGSFQPYFISTFVDSLVSAPDLQEQLHLVYIWSLIFIGLFLIIYTGWRAAGYAGALFSVRQNAKAAQLLYQYAVRHSHSYFSDNFAGSVSNKIAHASDGSSEMVTSVLYDVLRHSTSIIVAGVLLVLVSPYLTLGFFLVVVITLTINYFLVQIRRPMVERYSESTTMLRGQIIDTLTNIQAVRQYSFFDREEGRINSYIRDRAQKNLK